MSLLAERFPGLPPPLPIARLPTPVAPLAVGGVPLWVKREGLAGALYGGNKIRKLAWILPRIPPGAAALSLGAAGSNHLVATGLYCRQRGIPFECVLVPQPETPHVRDNLWRIHGLARRCWPAGSDAAAGLAVARALAASALRGQRVHPIWIGGSTPRGCLGWAEAALELAAQVEAGALPEPSDIFVACGSGGTAAGLLVGLGLTRLECRIHAVRVTGAVFSGRRAVQRLALRAAAELRRHGPVPQPARRRLVIHSEVFDPGYGHSNPATEAALAEGAAAGLTLEATYTGKALAACLGAVRRGEVGPEVLLIHTLSERAPPPPDEPLPRELERLLLSTA